MTAARVRIGDILAAKYRVERVLGQGGMGVVVAALHLRLRERVALKLLAPHVGAHADVVARFVREGRAAMRIRSEHVVRVHDVGTLETGEPYLVMEYLEGRDLAATLDREGPLPIEIAIEYVLQAIEALAEAHAMGIVHRDLKPSNLFLTRRADGSPVVKVLDFGIAKSTRADSAVTATESSGLMGTPTYMAPEQLRSSGAIDARTDIWALGVTLHVLLTGTRPFAAGSAVEIHEHIQRGAPPLRASRPDAPASLEAALARCMQPAQDDRYASVAELAAALAEHAPPHARVSAERAARILQAPPRQAPPAEVADAAQSTQSTRKEGDDTAAEETTEITAQPSWRDAKITEPRTGAPFVTPAPSRGPSGFRRGVVLVGLGAVGGMIALATLEMRWTNRVREAESTPFTTSRSAAPDPPPIPSSVVSTTPSPSSSAIPSPSSSTSTAAAMPASVSPRASASATRAAPHAAERPHREGRAPAPALPDPLADPD